MGESDTSQRTTSQSSLDPRGNMGLGNQLNIKYTLGNR